MLDSELINNFLQGRKVTSLYHTESFFLSEERDGRTIYTKQYIFVASIMQINEYCQELTIKEKYVKHFEQKLLNQIGYLQTGLNIRDSIVYRKYFLENHTIDSGDVFTLRRQWWRNTKRPALKTLIMVKNNWHLIQNISSHRKDVLIEFPTGNQHYSVNDIIVWATSLDKKNNSKSEVESTPKSTPEPEPKPDEASPEEKDIIDIEPKGMLIPDPKPTVSYDDLLKRIDNLESGILYTLERLNDLDHAENRLDMKVRFLLFNLRPD